MSTSETGEIWIKSVDFINLNVLIMILYYTFGIGYYQVKLDKGYRGSICILSYKCM